MTTSVEAIIDRDICPRDKVQLGIAMAELGECSEKIVHITVTPKRRKSPARIAQHGYYRACVLPIARMFMNESQGGMPDETGGFRPFTADEVHTWLKVKLIGNPTVNTTTGEIDVSVVPSCARMSAKEMFHFTELVIEFLKQNEVNMPPPDPGWREARNRAMSP